MQVAAQQQAGSVPPVLLRLRNVTKPAAHRELLDFYGAGGAAAGFKLYLDDACALPSDWRSTWASPPQWGLAGEKNWPTKYAAAGFIPHMVSLSPFVTANWREASASIVVLFARQYAGGPAIVQQQCLQRLRSRSAAWAATNGSRHFFIFTDSRGPCCLDGKYKDVDFLKHHVIGPHGEPEERQTGWFFRRGEGPRIRCFDEAKDVNIPTPNIHFPRTPKAPELPPVPADSKRDLLMFYAGWNYGVRMKLVQMYSEDPEVFVRRKVAYAEYKERMLSAKFCPVCGGFSQWTPRLAEALYYECVPVLLSPQWLPPFSSLLDWSAFSVRIHPDNIGTLKQTLRGLDHASLLAGVRAAKAAVTYKLDGYAGDDMLPLLIFEVAKRAQVTPVPPPGVVSLANDVETDRDYDVGVRNVQSQRAHAVHTSAAVGLPGGEGWECESSDGYMCKCRRTGAAEDAALASADGSRGWKGTGRRRRQRPRRGGTAELSAASAGLISPATDAVSAHVDEAAAAIAAAAEARSCPPPLDLEVPELFDRVLAARASASGDIVILILGPTSGARAIKMGSIGVRFVLNMVANLKRLGVHNYVAISTNLKMPGHPQNNLCLSELSPLGVCCAYAGVGMDLVGEGAVGREWTLSQTHPYMLFLQRWWFTGQAVGRGYNVLSLDTDMHLGVNPLALVRSAAHRRFDAMLQLDSAWPVEAGAEGQRPTDERGQHENLLPCRSPELEAVAVAAAGRTAPLLRCGCGVMPMPLLNTGFVWARGGRRVSGSAAATASAARGPQWLLFNRSVGKILQRLSTPPHRTGKGEVDPHAVWAQDVVNEVASELSTLPSPWPASCHKKDTACAQHALAGQDVKDAKRRWWLPRRTHSVWLASRPLTSSDDCRSRPSSPSPFERQLVGWTQLRPQQELVAKLGVGRLEPPTAALGALPREAVGRLCGARLKVELGWLRRAPPLQCEGFDGSLGSQVLHMQFTNAETRKDILEGMQWWFAAPDAHSASDAAATNLTCTALARGAPASASVEAVAVSSAMVDYPLLCMLPGPRKGQAVALQPGAQECPCCWRADELHRAASAASDHSAQELKTLSRAVRYAGCRIWRRFA